MYPLNTTTKRRGDEVLITEISFGCVSAFYKTKLVAFCANREYGWVEYVHAATGRLILAANSIALVHLPTGILITVIDVSLAKRRAEYFSQLSKKTRQYYIGIVKSADKDVPTLVVTGGKPVLFHDGKGNMIEVISTP